MSLTPEQELKLNRIAGGPLSDRELQLLRESMAGIESIIKLCGDDPKRDGLLETPYRVVKAYLEYTKGMTEDPKQHLHKSFEVDCEELVLVKDIEFNSLCEHHFAPFFGKAHVAYIPQGGAITGLSKIARMVDGYAERFQVQEHLTKQIADAMVDVLNPYGVMVIVEAKHYCMCGRGIKKASSSTTTSAVRGLFRDSDTARNEVLQLIKG